MKTWQLIKHMEEGGKIKHKGTNSTFSMDIFRALMEDEELSEVELIFIDPESFEFYVEPRPKKLVNALVYIDERDGEICFVKENSSRDKMYRNCRHFVRFFALDQKDKEIDE